RSASFAIRQTGMAALRKERSLARGDSGGLGRAFRKLLFGLLEGSDGGRIRSDTEQLVQQSHLVVDLFGREIGRWGVNKILVAGVNVRSSEIAAVRQSTGSVEN